MPSDPLHPKRISLEFYEAIGLTYIEYNRQTYTLQSFLKTDVAGIVFHSLENEIHGYSQNTWNKSKTISKKEAERIVHYIHSHFSKKDRIFDLIILNPYEPNKRKVILNPEE